MDGEAIALAPLDTTVPKAYDHDAINAKYRAGDVRIITEQGRYPLPTVRQMVEDPKYILQPIYQRRHRWDDTKRSRLIESFIMNVPIPPIFLYERDYSTYEVMDGLQRLTAIHAFYTDAFALSGLLEWHELNGLTYSTLPEQVRLGIDRRYLSSIILLQETARDPAEAQRLKQMVFERINSGGERLEYQESRNAVYNGPLNQLCIELARSEPLCLSWGIPAPTQEELQGGDPDEERASNTAYRKMEDVELVLRFFAYRQRLMHDHVALNVYLDEFLKRGNTFNQGILDKYRALFTGTIALAYDLLGPKAFWLYRVRAGSWSWLSRPTKVVYDPLMYVLSLMLEHGDKLRQASEKIRTGLEGFYRENYSNFEGRYVNRQNLLDRNQLLFNYFNTFTQ